MTDGTTVDTSEITASGVSSVLSTNSNPDFTVFGNEVLFAGNGSSGYPGLWETNGTPAGTSELNVVGAYKYGLDPSNFTVLGSEVIFDGLDQNQRSTLWVTNGTTAGTSEITVPTSNNNGIFFIVGSNPDFTVLGTKVLFRGDGAGGVGLWVTDGTTTGTSELTSAGSSTLGLLYFTTNPDITALGSNAVFTTSGNGSLGNLWVTNGTAAGTSELSVSGAYSGGSIASQGAYFTVFGHDAIFLGVNTNDQPTVGVTNGTSEGSSELTVGGAYSGGLFDWSTSPNPEFTALGNEVLFEGEDQSGHLGLWVTNGTVLGTSELTGIANAYSGGLFASGVNPDITANGSVALFDGYDSSGHLQLWVTNGTVAGTSEVVAAGADSSGLNPTDFAFLPISSQPPPDDFPGNGKSDILWQNTSGQAAIWLMNGTTPTSEAVAGPNPGPSWKVIGATGDFTDNGKSDILWQNTDGQAAIWLMNGITPTSEAVVGGNPGTSWHVVGSGDFNGDGKSDILWQNTSGQAAIWLMNGTTPTSEAVAGPNPGPSWQIVGTGDFTGNGKSDILFQNTNGQAAIWLMNGTTPTAEAVAGPNPGPSWHVAGTGDFTGNGISDILWQNTDGQAAIWLMNGTSPTAEAVVGSNPGPSWHIAGTGDYNGDGKSDILWQNTSGQAAVWLMNGTTPISEALVGPNPGTSWHIPTGA